MKLGTPLKIRHYGRISGVQCNDGLLILLMTCYRFLSICANTFIFRLR
jgi:hypothetical protein